MHRVGLIVPHDFKLLSPAPMMAFEMTGLAWRLKTASGFGPIAKPPVKLYIARHVGRTSALQMRCGLQP